LAPAGELQGIASGCLIEHRGKRMLLAVSPYLTRPGDEYFKGCSGAPVLDENGNVMALVCCGDAPTDEIWAIAVARYRVALDILGATDN
jgi:hypothetical protein